MVSLAMRKTADICRAVYGDAVLAAQADSLAQEIEDGINTHGVMHPPGSAAADATGRDSASSPTPIYAYETDGLGNYTALDDANTPSLLSLPYFGFEGKPEIMNNTRKWVLSQANPWFLTGDCASGMGSSHIGNAPK